MRVFAMFVNRDKPTACEVKQRIETLLDQHGVQAISIDTGRRGEPMDCDAIRAAELGFVLGGDGTLLGVARHVAPLGIPLLGINVGHLGFLTEAEPTDLDATVTRVIRGDYDLEPRMMLEASIVRDGQEGDSWYALNDVGIAKGSFARMVSVDLFVDDVFVDSYSGDGVIVSTPTGSTAYSLSCGGPIVVPHLQVMLITPICPHTLFARPSVIDSQQQVRLVVHATHEDVGLTMDGQVGVRLKPGDMVYVRAAPVQTTLVKWRDKEFFTILRQKLHGQNGVSLNG